MQAVPRRANPGQLPVNTIFKPTRLQVRPGPQQAWQRLAQGVGVAVLTIGTMFTLSYLLGRCVGRACLAGAQLWLHLPLPQWCALVLPPHVDTGFGVGVGIV